METYKGWVYRVRNTPYWRFFCRNCFIQAGTGIHTTTKTWELAYRDAYHHMGAHHAARHG
jgi:hypothetical protein